jgi:hypothetical protein
MNPFHFFSLFPTALVAVIATMCSCSDDSIKFSLLVPVLAILIWWIGSLYLPELEPFSAFFLANVVFGSLALCYGASFDFVLSSTMVLFVVWYVVPYHWAWVKEAHIRYGDFRVVLDLLTSSCIHYYDKHFSSFVMRSGSFDAYDYLCVFQIQVLRLWFNPPLSLLALLVEWAEFTYFRTFFSSAFFGVVILSKSYPILSAYLFTVSLSLRYGTCSLKIVGVWMAFWFFYGFSSLLPYAIFLYSLWYYFGMFVIVLAVLGKDSRFRFADPYKVPANQMLRSAARGSYIRAGRTPDAVPSRRVLAPSALGPPLQVDMIEDYNRRMFMSRVADRDPFPEGMESFVSQGEEGVDLTQSLLSYFPGLDSFVRAHPFASAILTSTWLTRTYYSCRYPAGIVATIAEILVYLDLAVDPTIVPALVDKIAIDPLLDEPRSKGDFVSQGVLDWPQQVAAGMFTFAGAIVGVDPGEEALHAMRVSQFASSRVKDLVGFIVFAKKLIDALSAYVRWKIFGPTDSEKLGEYVKWYATQASEFALVDPQTLSRPQAERLLDLYDMGHRLRRTAMQWPESVRKEFLLPMERSLAECGKIHTTLLDYARHSGARPEPDVRFFIGAPSTMKSLLTSFLAEVVLIHLNNGISDPSLVYYHNPALDHMDGYRASTLVTICNDAFNLTDETRAQNVLDFFMSVIDHAELNIKMAAIENKGMKYRAPSLLASSNVNILKWFLADAGSSPWHMGLCPGGGKIAPAVGDVNATGRRFQNVYLVELASESSKAQLLAAEHTGQITLDLLESVYRITLVAQEARVGEKHALFARRVPVTVREIARAMLSSLDARRNRKAVLGQAMTMLAKDFVGKGQPGPTTAMAELESIFVRISSGMKTVASDVSDTVRSRFEEAGDHLSRLLDSSSSAPVALHTASSEPRSKPTGVASSLLGTPSPSSPETFVSQNKVFLTPEEEEALKRARASHRKAGGLPEKRKWLSQRQFRRARRAHAYRMSHRRSRRDDSDDEDFVSQGSIFDTLHDYNQVFGFVGNVVGVTRKVRDFWPILVSGVIGVVVFPFGYFLMGYAAFSSLVFSLLASSASWLALTWRRVYARRKLFLSVMAALVVVLILIGFVAYVWNTRSDVVSSSYDSNERKAPPSSKPIHTSAVMRHIDTRKVDSFVPQDVDVPDPNGLNMVAALCRSGLGLVTSVNGRIRGTLFVCVGYELAYVPGHFWRNVPDHGEVQFMLPNGHVKNFWKREMVEYAHLPYSDSVYLKHPFFQSRSRVPSFMTYAEIEEAVSKNTRAVVLTLVEANGVYVPMMRDVSNLHWAYNHKVNQYADIRANHLVGTSGSRDGECGSILLFLSPHLRTGRFAGHLFGRTHTTGSGLLNYFLVICKEDMQALVPTESESMTSQCLDEEVGDGMLAYSRTHGLRFHGLAAQPVFQPAKQGIVPSLIYSFLLQRYGPPTTRPTVCTSDFRGVEYGMSKWRRAKPDLPLTACHDVLGHIWHRWPAPKLTSILSLQESIEGKEGYHILPIRQASGPGYGFDGKKGKFPFLDRKNGPDEPRVPSKALMESMERRLQDAARGSGWCPSETYQKNERLSKEKFQNRLTDAVRINDQILERSLFAPWLDMMRRLCPDGPCMVGFNPFSLHWHHMEVSGAHDNIIALDISGFDISVLRAVLIYVCSEIISWFRSHIGDGLNWLRWNFLWCSVVYHFHVVMNMLLSRDGVSSGCIFTAEINSLVCEVLFRMAFYYLLRPSMSHDEALAGAHRVVFFSYGDDARAYVPSDLSNLIDNESVARVLYEKFGMVATPSHDKNAPLSKWPPQGRAVFLKRTRVKLESFWFGAFPMDQCVEIARWITKGHSPKEMTTENCEMALRELAFYGKAVFDEYFSVFSTGLAAAGCPPIKLTYDSWWEGIFAPRVQPVKGVQGALLGPVGLLHGAPIFESSPEEAVSVAYQQEEGGLSILEQGVRLLKNKGFPVDVQHILGLLAERRACDLQECEVLSQPAIFYISTASVKLAQKTLGPSVDQASAARYIGSAINFPGLRGEPVEAFVSQMSDRDPQTLPHVSENNTQVTKDEVPPEVVAESAPVTLSYYQLGNLLPDQGLKEALSRPYEVARYTWTGTEVSGTNIMLLNFPYHLFIVDQVEEKLKWQTYFRAKGVLLDIFINLTKFHYGAINVSHVEGQLTWGAWLHDHTFQQRLNNDPTFMSAMGSPHKKIFLPWKLPWQWLPITCVTGGAYAASTDYNLTPMSGIMQRVHVDVVQQLGMLGAAVNPGSITVMANFVDPEVQGPIPDTPPFPPLPAERFVSQSAEFARKVELGVASAETVVDSAIRASSKVVSLAFHAAESLAPLDKPAGVLAPMAVSQNWNYGMTHRDGVDPSPPLTLDSSPKFATTGITDEKMLSVLDVARTPGCLDLFTIEGAGMESGELVRSWYVHPNYNLNALSGVGVQQEAPHYLEYISMLFDQWRGSIKYQFRFFAPAFTTAKFRFVWFPCDKHLASIPPAVLAPGQVGNLYTQVFDVTGDTVVEFEVRWLAPFTHRKTWPLNILQETAEDIEAIFIGGTATGSLFYGTSNGIIALYVVNEIATPTTTTAANITAVAYVAAGSDYELKCLAGVDTLHFEQVYGVHAPPAESFTSQSGNLRESFQRDFDPLARAMPVRLEHVSNPDSDCSIVELCKRATNFTSSISAWVNPLTAGWDFKGASSGCVQIYLQRLFAWSRIGWTFYVVPSSVESVTLQARADGCFGNATMIIGTPANKNYSFRYYPHTNLPFWPTSVDPWNSSSTQSYLPLRQGNSGYELVNRLSGGTNPYMAFTDDSLLFGLYAPPMFSRDDPVSTTSKLPLPPEPELSDGPAVPKGKARKSDTIGS